MRPIRLEKSEGVYGPTIQGEGINTGQVVSFVRLYGCDFRCNWCDTPFSLGKDKGGAYEEVHAIEIIQRLDDIGCKNVVLSGGNPLAQGPNLEPLIEMLADNWYWVQVETQGSIIPQKSAARYVDFWSLSPKLPSAGKVESENWNAVPWFLQRYTSLPIDSLQLKFVVSNREDYEYMKAQLTKLEGLHVKQVPIILQPEGMQNDGFDLSLYTKRVGDLLDTVHSDRDYWKPFECVRVLPQLHKMVFGAQTRRV